MKKNNLKKEKYSKKLSGGRFLLLALLIFHMAGSVLAADCASPNSCVQESQCVSGKITAETCEEKSQGIVCCSEPKAVSSQPATSSGNTTSSAFVNQEKIPGQKQTDNLIDYLNGLYTFGIAIAGILAVVMISLGAFSYIVTSGGNSSKMLDAKDMITEAIFGLILALAAYLLLFVLNPDLIGGTVNAPTNVINTTK